MANRYRNNEIRKTEDGTRVYRTRIRRPIPLKDSDLYVVTQTGDRLDSLAAQYYNDSRLWWIIADANNVHNALLSLPEGTTLRIPMEFLEILANA